jgi:hypothetical protein
LELPIHDGHPSFNPGRTIRDGLISPVAQNAVVMDFSTVETAPPHEGVFAIEEIEKPFVHHPAITAYADHRILLPTVCSITPTTLGLPPIATSL